MEIAEVVTIVIIIILIAGLVSLIVGLKKKENLTTDNLFYYGMPKLSEPVYDQQ
jgi:hypothetical protein